MATAASVYGAARCRCPFPDGTRVYVDELTFRVVAHATSAEGKRSVPQLHRWSAGKPDIKRIRFDML